MIPVHGLRWMIGSARRRKAHLISRDELENGFGDSLCGIYLSGALRTAQAAAPRCKKCRNARRKDSIR